MTVPPARFVPDVDLPPYAYVPGKSPRPESGPPFEISRPLPADFAVHSWHGCRCYLYGLDLFNRGFYWEAHEAWEVVWHATGGNEPTCSVIKGLIKLAAAGVKTRQGSAAGRRRHARRAAALFGDSAERASSGPLSRSLVLGLSLPWLIQQTQKVASEPVELPEAGAPTAPHSPARVFDFYLEPLWDESR